MNCNAMVLEDFNKPLVKKSIEIKEPVGEEVVIKILASGMCGTDLGISRGIELKPGFKLPMVLGHENVGKIISTGTNVKNFNIGDIVAVYPAWGCGNCRWCHNGFPNLCPYQTTPGQTGYNGGYAEYMMVPSYRWLYNIGKLKPVDIAPLVDAGTTSMGAVLKILPSLLPSSTVIINGIGGIATYAVQILRALAPYVRIIAVSRKPEHLQFASELGADIAITPAELPALIDKETHGSGVDAAIDLVSTADTIPLLNKLLTVNGKLILVGAYGSSAPIDVFPTMVYQHSIMGSNYGTYENMVDVINMYARKFIKSYVVKRQLDEANKGLMDMASRVIIGRQVIVQNE